MSGGSFDYLYAQDNPPVEDLRRMSGWLREHGFEDAAAQTSNLASEASDELREVWHAVEWFTSSDWGYEPVLEAVGKWRATQLVQAQGKCGAVSPDGSRVCILDPGHEKPHPWELTAPLQQLVNLARPPAHGEDTWEEKQAWDRYNEALTKLAEVMGGKEGVEHPGPQLLIDMAAYVQHMEEHWGGAIAGSGPLLERFANLMRKPLPAGRFTLVAEDNIYVTSWDTWEEAAVAWPEEGRMIAPYRLVDNETGCEWLPGARHEWEDART